MEDTSTTSKIAKVLELLSDGHWHLLDEVQQKTELDKNQTRQVLVFLKKYGFINVDERKERIKLDETFLKFLMQVATS